MKSLGIVRIVDHLGRIVIPKEMKDNLGIGNSTPLEFFIDEESQQIHLRKYQANSCMFCATMEPVINYRKKHVCHDCLANIQQGGYV